MVQPTSVGGGPYASEYADFREWNKGCAVIKEFEPVVDRTLKTVVPITRQMEITFTPCADSIFVDRPVLAGQPEDQPTSAPSDTVPSVSIQNEPGPPISVQPDAVTTSSDEEKVVDSKSSSLLSYGAPPSFSLSGSDDETHESFDYSHLIGAPVKYEDYRPRPHDRPIEAIQRMPKQLGAPPGPEIRAQILAEKQRSRILSDLNNNKDKKLLILLKTIKSCEESVAKNMTVLVNTMPDTRKVKSSIEEMVK